MSKATIILTGGMSTRFGVSKPFLPLCGEPLLSHVIRRALTFSDEIVLAIGMNDSPQRYGQFLSSRVKLSTDDSFLQSPLVGVLTGLRRVESDYSLVLPCDAPFVNQHVADLLFHKASGADAAIPRWPNGNIEPLHSVYSVARARSAAEETLMNGQLRVSEMIARLDYVVCVNVEELRGLDEDLLTFLNINTPEDLDRAEEVLKARSRLKPR